MTDVQAQRDAIVKAARDLTYLGKISQPTHTGRAVNPFCGDEIAVSLDVHENIITTVKAEIKGCLVTQAAWNLLAEQIQGQHLSDAIRISQGLRDSLHSAEMREIKEPLQKLMAFRHPSPRKRCASLASEAVLAALVTTRN